MLVASCVAYQGCSAPVVWCEYAGGGHSWENLVTACKSCNHRKGGKTLEEARYRLHRAPFEPRSDVYSMFTPYLADDRNEAWRTYLFLGRN